MSRFLKLGVVHTVDRGLWRKVERVIASEVLLPFGREFAQGLRWLALELGFDVIDAADDWANSAELALVFAAEDWWK